MNRRDFLAAVGAGAAASTLLPRIAFGSGQATDKELITRLQAPFCGEPPGELLAENWITPNSRFYVLNHGKEPEIDLATYRLHVAGDVERPLSLTYRELQEDFPRVTVDATLMCAGNRRYEMHREQSVDAVPLWRAQAVGNARWSGVLLSDVLKKAGLRRREGHVHLNGADPVTFKETKTNFAGSIPLARVAQRRPGQVLLAYEMNGQPLPRSHGFPVRAVVPGMIGARSVKWLRELRVEAEESDNRLFQKAHQLAGKNADRAPIYEFPVTSAILSQGPVVGGMTVLKGYALVGGNDSIASVMVSTSGGKRWQAATLLAPKALGCWRLWKIRLPFVPGTEVIAKATTRRGNSMPASVAWNKNGYLYNAWSTWQMPTS